MKDYEQHKKNFLKLLSESASTMPSEYQKVAKYIRRYYKKVSFMNLPELTEKLSIEEEIINNYISNIGFQSFEEFRNELRHVAMVDLKTTDRFQISMDMINPKVNSIMNLVVNKEISNLKSLSTTLNEQTFASIVGEVIKANEIIVVGTRASAPITLYAEYMLNRIGKRTGKIMSGGTENLDSLSLIDRSSLVIGFGFARYPKETIKLLSFFKKRNMKIISITDNLMSPLARFSDIVMTIPCESMSFTDFYATPICVINALVILVSQLDEHTSLKHLNEFENIAKDMGFYF
ncbi:MAG: hypothetical protein APF77_20445 [Clostridia bacterium BRH_c25]|nr:MAG: hypothetical protein APF77_20445 [Clostridia bacterium BRH_c25]